METWPQALEGDPDAARLGIRPAPASDPSGLPLLEMEVRPDHLNFLDVTHGGALFSLAVCAVRVAAGREREVVDAHLTLTAATREGDVLVASVEEATRGRTLAAYRVVVRRGDGRIVGLLTATARQVSEAQ